MKKIAVIIGARPQFIKHAPVELSLKKYFNVFSVHTGQHYDDKMSEIFFRQLGITKPAYMLNVGSASHGKQTGLMLEKIEEILLTEKPIAVVVYGDTNSTLAGALAASKLQIPVIHIEAGLRSFNKTMPEETNRIITDHLSDYLFAPTKTAVNNLRKEGINKSVYLTGDVMYDSIILAQKVLNCKFKQKNQILVTLHRPYNTDDIVRLKSILHHLNNLGTKIIFPLHPRTFNILKSNSILTTDFENIQFTAPVSYFDLIKLQMECSCIITDSGGIQKEAYLLRKKCITLRSETEWIETLKNGWNTLIFYDLSKLNKAIMQVPGNYTDNLFGFGNSSDLIANILNKELNFAN